MGKSRYFYVILLGILLINIYFVITVIKSRHPRNQSSNYGPSILDPINISSEFFNTPCPDIRMISTGGENLVLKEYAGKVLILRFSRFGQQDTGDLLFLDHLYGLYKDIGLKVIFIKVLMTDDSFYPLRNVRFQAPIVEDDGYVASIFQASIKDTYIYGKDLKNKLKSSNIENRSIYYQTRKLLFADHPNDAENLYEKSEYFKRIRFYNVDSGTEESLIVTGDRYSIVSLIISPCLKCPENKRILLYKDLAERKEDINIYILFGSGNDIDSIKRYFSRYQLLRPNIKVGVIRKNIDLHNLYYSLFSYDLDSRLVILNRKGKVVFAEDPRNYRSIDLNLVMGLIK